MTLLRVCPVPTPQSEVSMLRIDRDPQRLVLTSGSTTVVLDKETNQAVLQRKLLFWARKPVHCAARVHYRYPRRDQHRPSVQGRDL